MSDLETEARLRSQLGKLRRQNRVLWLSVWILLVAACAAGGAAGYLYLNRDVPLVQLAPDVRDAPPRPPDLPPPPTAAPPPQAAEAPLQLPPDSAIGADRRAQVIEVLDAFARQDGRFNPCAPQAHANSQMPAAIADFLLGRGLSEAELRFLEARYALIWQTNFRQTATALPADSQRRQATCTAMMAQYLGSEAGRLGIDTVDQALGVIRQIVSQ